MVRRHAELQILSPRFQIVEGLPDVGWHARRVNVVSAVTGADETNLVVANLAHFEFNVRRIIARVNNPLNAWRFTPERVTSQK